jgi:hypothetical protein
MDSAMIGKIEKSKRYAAESERITIRELHVDFAGDHDTYQVSFDNGTWSCGCRFFAQRGVCSHTMTLERVFGERLVGVAPYEEMDS